MSYIAMNSKGKRQLILQTEKSAIVIAEEGKSEIALLETFAPDVNNKNTVVFRATSISGKRGVYVFEDQKLTKIVEEGDPIVCDLPGECFVLLKEGFPGISGGVAINDLGDIAIHLVLTDKTMEYPLGGSIYVFKKN
jgi:hypothetical protein